VNQEPPYARIASDIRRRIATGQLKPGERIASARQIVREHGVAIATATKVLSALRDEGLVRTLPGVGTVVAEETPSHAPRPPRRREPRAGDADPTRDRIVRAAIRLADEEGLAGLSMRRVAAELGVATMSLYRHVAGKDELVLLMADRVFGEDPFPDPAPAGWRARLELVARRQWAIYRRHPWMASTVSFTRPMPSPNGMVHTEWTMRALDGLGLDLTTVFLVAISLTGYVRGIAVNLESEAEAVQDTGMTSDEWMDAHEATWAALMASGRFPMLSRIGQSPDFEYDLDRLFEFGVGLVLDGFAALLDRPTAVLDRPTAPTASSFEALRTGQPQSCGTGRTAPPGARDRR
jgi:AcrR family transcriptional regulator